MGIPEELEKLIRSGDCSLIAELYSEIQARGTDAGQKTVTIQYVNLVLEEKRPASPGTAAEKIEAIAIKLLEHRKNLIDELFLLFRSQDKGRSKIKILIADDHSVIRTGVKHILKKEFPEMEFGEATNAIEALKKIQDQKWDMLILDINMPGRNGFDILKQMKDQKIGIPVLVFSIHPEDMIAVRALKAGASGYLSKNAADKELIKAVHLLLQGRKYITLSVAELMASQLENPENIAPHQLLSDREYQTLLMIAAGLTVSQIAANLSLGISTIGTYRARIMEKMNLKNNAELTHYVVENKLNQ